jgi:predicted phosphodiesterase
MKICAISDVHYPQNRESLKEAVSMTNNADALVIAGDISDDLEHYDEVLKHFSRFGGLKTAVLGNHDLYAIPGSDSYQKFRDLDEICRENDFYLLDLTSPV